MNELLPTRYNSTSFSNFEPKIPEYILELLWFANGPRANCKDISRESTIKYGNLNFRVSFENGQEPSSIDTLLQIGDKESVAEKMDYYPSYKKMSPAQRICYLYWLTNITQPIEIGYVFVFYYGLERHLMFGEFDKALKVLLTLRKHFDNKSFQDYSSNAIFFASLYNHRWEIFDELNLDTFPIEIQLMVSAARHNYFSPELLMKAHKKFGFENKRYIVGESELFKSILEIKLTEKYKFPFFPVQFLDFKQSLDTFTVFLANYSFCPENRCFEIPDISTSESVQKEIKEILTQVHESVKVRKRELRSKTKH